MGSEDDVHKSHPQIHSTAELRSDGFFDRLYVIESLLSVTGFNATTDCTFPAGNGRPGRRGGWHWRFLRQSGIAGLEGLESPPVSIRSGISECAQDLLQNRRQVTNRRGASPTLVVHLLANALNAALENIGKTILFHAAPESKEQGIAELAQALKAERVQTLVILGGNPV